MQITKQQKLEYNYTITLNEEEAKILACLVGRVGGLSELREVINKLYKEFKEAGINPLEYDKKFQGVLSA